jgi:hypothetical protein
MIAPASGSGVQNTTKIQSRAAEIIPVTRTRGPREMDFPWFALLFNLALLGVALFACRLVNASRGILKWNGALIFLMLCVAAMLLDFTLTMVFASAHFHAHTGYDAYGSRAVWTARVLTYLIPCAISLLLAWRFRRRQRFAHARAQPPARAGWKRRVIPVGIDALTSRE